MTHSKHCKSCIHSNFHLENGLTCKLTRQKPDFYKTCIKLEFSYDFLSEYEDLKSHYQDLKKTRKNVYINFGILFLISLPILFWARSYWASVTFSRAAVKYTSIVMGTGFLILTIALGNLKRYLKKIAFARGKLEEMQEIVDLYKMKV